MAWPGKSNMDEKLRVALFIDAENVAPSHVHEIIEHAKGLGRLTLGRCYGNGEALKGWYDAMGRNHLRPVQTLIASGKQNASDFALTIDAVSLLHRDMFDVAIIASSDADFAPLALHIREHGRSLYAVGDGKKLKPTYRGLFDHVFEFAPKPKKPAAAPKADPVPQKPAKPEIPVAEIVTHYKAFNKSERVVSVPSFARYLGNRMPKDYRKGFGTVANYLQKSGAFVIAKDNTIALKVE
jgi:NYN domain